MSGEDRNGWNEYEKLVLDKLDKLEQGHGELRAAVASIKTDLAVQKVKAGMWGALAGAVPAAVMFLVDHWTGGSRK